MVFRWLLSFCFLLCLLSFSSNVTLAKTRNHRTLRQVEQKIKDLSYKQYKIAGEYKKTIIALKQVKKQVSSAYLSLLRARKQLPQQQQHVKERLARLLVLQQIEDITKLPGFFSWRDYQQNRYFLQFNIKRQVDLISSLSKKIVAVKKLQVDLTIKKQELSDLMAKEQFLLTSIQAEKTEQKQFLTYIHSQAKLEEQWKNVQKQREKQINSLLHASKTKKYVSLFSLKGALLVPVQGILVKPYQQGMIYKKGVLVQTKENAAVKSVFQGVVRFVGDFQEGYGKLVIIEQGEGNFILYGNLKNIKLKQGDKVKEGQVIGMVKTKEKPLFYFEMRYRNHVVDPMRWFKEKQW